MCILPFRCLPDHAQSVIRAYALDYGTANELDVRYELRHIHADLVEHGIKVSMYDLVQKYINQMFTGLDE